jgi:ribosomal-protein-alanine N-acetyltransferase
MQPIEIRRYGNEDLEDLVALLRLNTPMAFAPEEEKDFVHYLMHEEEEYFVILKDAVVIGCGGINFQREHKTAVLSWDMLHPSYQRQGFGTQLLQHRLGLIRQDKTITRVVVRTSQLSCDFYSRAGFHLTEKIEDYWAPGYHMNKMERDVVL